jgi:UDP-3-O-[3-hydroxymyristoyl] glucosamine N-acyltransferase
MYLKQLVKQLNAELFNPPDGDVLIEGVAPLDRANARQVSFITDESYLKFLSSTKAAAVIVKAVIDGIDIPQIVHANPYYIFAKTAQIFHPGRTSESGISPLADIGKRTEIGKNVLIMPYVRIGDDCKIGDNTVIHSHVALANRVSIGSASILYSNISIYSDCKLGERVVIHSGSVIGSDGFGYAPGADDIAKIPQVGGVVIEDDVEIGALCSVNSGTMTPTVIGKGSKIDSHCHIAHNCTIGQHSMLCGKAAMAGSSHVGNWCVIGGATNISNQVRIADRIRVGGMAGVTKSLSEPGDYMGFPAVPAKEWRKSLVASRRMSSLEKQVKELTLKFEKQIHTEK